MFEQHRMYGQRGTDGSKRLGFDRTDVTGGGLHDKVWEERT